MQPEDFRALYPEFSATSDAAITAAIAAADPYFDVARWAALYNDGLAAWTAHRLVMQNQAKPPNLASPGDILTKKVGDVSVTRDTGLLNAQAKNPFMRTTYGQMYLYLRRQVDIGVMAV